jgi:transcription elongation factor GreA
MRGILRISPAKHPLSPFHPTKSQRPIHFSTNFLLFYQKLSFSVIKLLTISEKERFMMNDTYYLTKEGEQRLREELEHLEGPARQDLARRLREAIQMGDLSENADYIAAKEEQGFLEGRIQELKYILGNVTTIEENGQGYDTVEVGATVTIQEGDYPTEVYYMVGSKEADPGNGRISNESPIGKALMGKRTGDFVDVETPGGVIQFKIVNIE